MIKKVFLISSFLAFPAFAEVFMLPQTNDILYDSKYPLNEYLIPDADNQCFFHYLSLEKMPDNYMIKVENQSYPGTCLDKGFAKVELIGDNKKTKQVWNGYFLNGFFIGSLPLNTKVIKRSSDENGTQRLDYLIDEDSQLKIRYLASMYSFLDKKQNYTIFDACHPVEITLQTSNKLLFEDKDNLKNIYMIVKNYAQVLCPEAKTIILKVLDSPSLDEQSIFFKQKLLLDDNGIWDVYMKDTDMVQTKQKEVTDNHNRFTSLEENKKYTEQLYSQSIATQVPVLGDFLVHVSEKTNENVVFIDQPFFMKVFKNNFNLSKGWYHIHALLEAMDDFEKKRTGISLNKKAALITIQEAIMCKEQFCTNQ